MDLRTLRLPLEEQRKFETRAATFFPREIEDFLIGDIRKGGLDVHLILPTRTDDVDGQHVNWVALKDIALTRARETARNMGLKVLGTIHTHPWKRWNGYGLLLSKADHRSFDWFPQSPDISPAPVLGVCAIYRTGVTPDRFQKYFAFWMKGRALRLTLKHVPPFLGPEITGS